jgi:Stress responsive A/B Barrel Domain
VIRHVVLLRFNSGATAEEIDSYAAAVPGLRTIPGVKSIFFGSNVSGETPGIGSRDVIPVDNWDFIVVTEFANYSDYLYYSTHPIHRSLISTHLIRILGERAALQVYFPE